MKEAKRDVFEWIEAWYNTHRLHSLDTKTLCFLKNSLTLTRIIS